MGIGWARHSSRKSKRDVMLWRDLSSEIQRRVVRWKSNVQRITRRSILVDRTLHNHHFENPKSDREFILVGKPESKIKLGEPELRWGDGIKMDLREIGCGHLNWVHLAQDRDQWLAIASMVMRLRLLWEEDSWLGEWLKDFVPRTALQCRMTWQDH
jgi:hypothetical protein